MKLGRRATLLIGGARSGKSDLAVRLGQAWPGHVTLAATAEAGDDDMAARIERHQADRPDAWGCLESPMFSAGEFHQLYATDDPDHLIIVDCLTMLVANLMFDESRTRRDHEIVAPIAEIAALAADRQGPTIIVSNEVGLGVHPETPLGRRYRDLLGRVNRRVADQVETALFVVAGQALRLEQIEIDW